MLTAVVFPQFATQSVLKPRRPNWVLVRPFFLGDADILVDSFSAWEGDGMPCELVQTGTGQWVPSAGPVDIVLCV